MFWIQGEEGIGKTRLIYELKVQAQLMGVPYLDAVCVKEGERPFGGLVNTAILVSPPDDAPLVSTDTLRSRYGMTPAEANLAALLVSDLSLDQAADSLGVKIGTVRTRLKQVFAKTGTNRQASLVRLLLTEAGAVRGD